MTGELIVTLKSDLCAGSGEAAGLSVDNDLCADSRGFPYLPARRLKGTLRQSARALAELRPDLRDCVDLLFGTRTGVTGCLRLRDAAIPGADSMRARLDGGQLPDVLREYARPLNITKLFTSVRGQTRMEYGIAADQSLRYTRVMNRYSALDSSQEATLHAPFSLDLTQIPPDRRDDVKDLFSMCCQATRHLGTRRNRGLGYVSITWRETASDASEKFEWPSEDPRAGEIQICYTLSLDAPVTLPDCGGQQLEIPARSVIGCVSAAWLKRPGRTSGDPRFRDLFLNGTVRWSSLTPVIGGTRSVRTPLTLFRMRNEKVYRNRLTTARNEVSGKAKDLSGTYVAYADGGNYISDVKTHAVYHHSRDEDGSLYLQESIDAGALYGGTATLSFRTPEDVARAKDVFETLKGASFAFGRSRSAEYAACTLVSLSVCPYVTGERETVKGQPLYAVLESDVVLETGGLLRPDPDAVRDALASELGIPNEHPVRKGDDAPQPDYCQYRAAGGYHHLWQMQKPQISVVRSGSVYGFVSGGGRVPDRVTIGAFRQEGFGVCRICTEDDIRKLSDVSERDADDIWNLSDVSGQDADRKEAESVERRNAALQSALTVEAARNVVRERVRDYYDAAKRAGGVPRTGIIGRLRLALSEARDYADLISRIESIRESDVSAEKVTSDRRRALNLVRNLCGADAFEPSAALLGDDLAALVNIDDAARSELERRWKEPLRLLFHLAYYDKD